MVNPKARVEIMTPGKVIIHQHRAPEGRELPSLRHDRQKTLILPPDRPDPFLQKIGIMTQKGQVRADMQKKLRQINEFLERLAETGELERLDRLPLTIVDCGCGSAHLLGARLVEADAGQDAGERRPRQQPDHTAARRSFNRGCGPRQVIEPSLVLGELLSFLRRARPRLGPSGWAARGAPRGVTQMNGRRHTGGTGSGLLPSPPTGCLRAPSLCFNHRAMWLPRLMNLKPLAHYGTVRSKQ